MHLSLKAGPHLVFRLLLAALILFPSVAAAANVKWIDPPPYSIVTNPKVVVSGFAAEPIPPEAIATVKQPQKAEAAFETKPRLQDGQIFHLTLELTPGRNNVLFDDSVYSIYYLADTSAKSVDPELASFRQYQGHLPEPATCTKCHSVYQRELSLNAEIFDLCSRCHGALKNRFKPASRAGHHEKNLTTYCIACHEPHASGAKGLLKEKGNLCANCHKERASGVGHDRASPQPCTLCHDPHLEINGPMLKKPKAELCGGCHDKAKLLGGPGTASSHQPVRTEPCHTCHTSHSEGNQSLLKAEPDILCQGCHKQMSFTGHVAKSGNCVACHKGHSATGPRLTRTGNAEFCATCHDKSYASGSGHKVPKDKECFACHNPHEQAAGKKVFQYCGSCHTLSNPEFTYAHGDMPFDTVRQCLTCHQIHRAEDAPKTTALMQGTPHYPLKNGGCVVCHMVKNSKVAMRYEGNENCIRCHGSTVGTSSSIDKEKVHAPIRQDDCIACHNPHFKNRPAMLLDEKERICEFCHGNVTRMGQNLHAPLKEKEACMLCHVPHYSETRPLLKEEQKALCLSCHPKIQNDLASQDLHGALKNLECAACHTPHSTGQEKMFRQPPGELCVGCHPEAVRDRNGTPFTKLHGPVGANQCTACHYFTHLHREEGDKFLQEKPAWRVCLDCHEVTDEHVPEVFTFRLARNQGGCLGCHYPHGSRGSYMLKE